MSSPEEHPYDEVKIEAADTTLMQKVGKGNLDKLLSPDAIKKANATISNSSDNFYKECVDEAAQLQNVIGQLKSMPPAASSLLQNVISTAFAIKTKAGQAGFNLVAALAKSLHILCEEIPGAKLTAPIVKVIDWHGGSIKHILSAKIKGDGGDVGKAILSEIDKLNAQKDKLFSE